MLHLLETPVGVALIKNEDEIGVVGNYMYKSVAEATESISAMSVPTAIPAFLKIFLEEHLKRVSEISVESPFMGKLLTDIFKIKTTCRSDLKVLKRNAFKWFGLNKDVYNGFLLLVSQNLAQCTDNDIKVMELLDMVEQEEIGINTRVMRIREWYSLHFPELNEIADHREYLEMLIKVGNKKSSKEELPESVNEWASTSMGVDMADADIEKIRFDAHNILDEMESIKRLTATHYEYTFAACPNLTELAGPVVASKLLRKAGSLSHLATYPASTVQILGSEKAFNEAVKSKGNTPKYGIIYDSKFLSAVTASKKGRLARSLAAKMSLCARVDLSGESRDGIFGKKMRLVIEQLVRTLNDEAAKKGKPQRKQKKRVISIQEFKHQGNDHIKRQQNSTQEN